MLAGQALRDAPELREWLASTIRGARDAVVRQVFSLMVPGLCSGLVTATLGGRGRSATGMRLVCRVAFAGMMAERFLAARDSAASLLARAASVSNGIAPVLVSASALTGLAGAPAFVTPISALCAAMLENWFSRVGLALCGSLAVLAAAGSLSDSLRTERLFAAGRRALFWALGTVEAAFIGVLSSQGMLATGRDGAASRAARLAVENLVPFIGQQVSDALGSITLSAAAVRGVAGVTAMAAAVCACAAPLLDVAAAALSARLAGAVAELAGDPGIGRMGDAFGDVVDLMLAMCISGLLLVLMLAAGATALGSAGL